MMVCRTCDSKQLRFIARPRENEEVFGIYNFRGNSPFKDVPPRRQRRLAFDEGCCTTMGGGFHNPQRLRRSCMRSTVARIAFSLALILLVASGSSAQETTGRDWMQWDETSRGFYMIGFVDGMRFVTKAIGADISSQPGITYQQASELVYRRLVREPELRSGPMTEIAISTLGPYLTLTDRSGRPYKAR
jgi:hypothetical protein